MPQRARKMPKIQDLAALAGVAERAARKAAEHIRNAVRPAPDDWDAKDAADFVTAVDRGSEEIIGEALMAGFPESTVVGEEFTPGGDTERGLVWVVDPLDGTTNYLHGFPAYAVSIGALLDGDLVAGVVLDVTRDVLYRATAGGGAWCGERRMAVSTITDPRQALLGTGFPFKAPANQHVDRYLRQLRFFLGATSGLRRAGAAALDLAHVADGVFEGFFEYGLAPWDVAAGILLVREAGGVVTHMDGLEAEIIASSFVAGNPAIHGWLLAALRLACQHDG